MSRLRILLAEQIFLELVAREMTQAELARELGVSQKHMSEVMNGKSGSPEFFDRVSAALGFEWVVTRC